MPGKSTKFDRCVEGVKSNSPGVDKPEAVCVSVGVKPESWNKSKAETVTLHKNGQWSLSKNALLGYPEPTSPVMPMKMNEDCYKDDEPHAPGSAKDSAHDIVEEDSDLGEEIKDLSPDERGVMMTHLRSLKDKRKLRSPENREKGKE